MTKNAPTSAELAAHSVVLDAIEAAWADSLPENPIRRHEEGGWIYFAPADGSIFIRRAPAGRQAAIDLNDPPEIEGAFVVGKFHTHPNPTAEGWHSGPSQRDIMVDEAHGVPDLIRADDGLHYSGPDCRRSGLTGPAGYPV